MRRTALLLALLGAACAPASSRRGPAVGPTVRSPMVTPAGPTGVVPSETGVPLADPRGQEVLDAVDGFDRSTIVVNDPPDTGDPELARYRTGAVLANATAEVERNRRLGVTYRLGPGARYAHRASVAELDEDRAVVRDCLVDDAQQVSAVDGRVLNDTVATKLFDTTLVTVGGTWKVADNRLLERWEGVAGCALDGS